MAGLVPAIGVFEAEKTKIPGTGPGMMGMRSVSTRHVRLMETPPSTSMAVPVVKLEASEAR